MTNKNVIGKCPICGGNVMETALGYCCDGTTKEGRRCQFVIHRQIHGVEITGEICSQLLTNGRTDVMEMKNKCGQPFQARFAIEHGKAEVELASAYSTVGCAIGG